MPDRWFTTEAWKWKNKEPLFEFIRKHKKSGVVLLSGDVHFAQFYHTNCKSLTGYDLTDLTTSGLTHHVNSFLKIWKYGLGQHFLNYVTPRFWNVSFTNRIHLLQSSENFVDFNFGLASINKVGDDV